MMSPTRSIAAACLLLALALSQADAQAGFGRGFVSYVKSSNEYYYDKSDAELQAFVQQTPAPSAQCCSDASAFVMKGCSCNQFFSNYVAPQQGFSAKTLAVLARAIQLSSCSASGAIANPCDSPQAQQAAPAAPQLIGMSLGGGR